MIVFFYNVFLLCALVLTCPWWLWRVARTEKYREGWRERIGRVPERLRGESDKRPAIWLHAVSVGEVLAVSRLIGEIETAFPAYRVLISTTTRTGQALARERFGAERVFYCPLDLPWVTRAYLQAIRPAILVLAETEFWPNLLSGCFRRGIPVAVVNARVSDRSWPRYRALRGLWKPLLSRLAAVLAQSAADAERLREIGCRPERVSVAGNLKFDVRAAQQAEAARLIHTLAPGLRIVVAGSTLDGEEAALLDAWPRLLAADPNVVLVLAPRHPERFADVAALLDSSGIRWMRRSAWKGQQFQPRLLKPGQVVLLDTIGELASVYSLASAAFVGGSLVPAGGHNPLEPAQFGVPIAMGPHVANFRAIADDLLAHDALRIVEPDQLADALAFLLHNRAAAEAMGARARQVFEQQAGATVRCVAAIGRLLVPCPRDFVIEPLNLSAPGLSAAADETWETTEPREHGIGVRHAGAQGDAGASRMRTARPLLLPLVPLYRLALATHDQRLASGRERVRRLSQPVISIGNLSAGGAGKTPLTIALARALTARGVCVDVLSRGYGRNDRAPARVRTDATAEEFGDEPLLIARTAGVPVYVAPERFDAGRLAEADAPAAAHILDDGFQHRQLYRDIDILLLNREDWNDRLLPAGNLRERLDAIRRASVVALPADDPELELELRAWGWSGPVWRLRRSMEVPPLAGPVVAFCGIARPDQFFWGLEAAGVKLAAWKVYRDHHRYTRRNVERLRKTAAKRAAAEVLTTEKDAVRMGALASALPLKTVPLRTEIEDEAAALDWLLHQLTVRLQQLGHKPAL